MFDLSQTDKRNKSESQNGMQRASKHCRYCEQVGHPAYRCFHRPRPESKPCIHCNSKFHLSWQCHFNPNREAQIKKKLKNGKLSKKWTLTRKQWFKDNPADHYECYICHKWMSPKETILDHVKSRGRHPELRFEMGNLRPCCWQCNTDKGSKDYE